MRLLTAALLSFVLGVIGACDNDNSDRCADNPPMGSPGHDHTCHPVGSHNMPTTTVPHHKEAP